MLPDLIMLASGPNGFDHTGLGVMGCFTVRMIFERTLRTFLLLQGEDDDTEEQDEQDGNQDSGDDANFLKQFPD